MTLGNSLLGRRHSLKTLADALQTPHRKLEAEHGKEIDAAYMEYLMRDVEVTWECYEALAALWQSYGLEFTPISGVYSEASIGKSALRQMGVVPFRYLESNSDDLLLAIAMETFYGGRSEVAWRRDPQRVVYVDFLSMYPTVCVLMNLWEIVTAKEVRIARSNRNTKRVARALRETDLPELLRSKDWRFLRSLVRIRPSGDLLPIRANYQAGSHTIGLNFLSATQPIWYTLADAIASKLLTGRSPEVIDAITVEPIDQQSGLRPLAIMGNDEYAIDPYSNDFYKRLIELRATTAGDERQALKLIANSTCYGIFAELNRRSGPKSKRLYITGSGRRLVSESRHSETPGLYFNPYLATFITGAARLMLATLERQCTDEGFKHVLCDTDSFAIRVESDSDVSRVGRIVESYAERNPYGKPIRNILKIEHGVARPTFAYAISAKRYALYATDNGTRNGSGENPPEIVHPSAHGLGALRPPDGNTAKVGNCPKWLIPVWQELIIKDGLERRKSIYLENRLLDLPASIQYTVTGYELIRYGMEPYSFASIWSVVPYLPIRTRVAVSSFVSHPKQLRYAYLTEPKANGRSRIRANHLRSYRVRIGPYYRHPESKFANGTERGELHRRHVTPERFVYIGKEISDMEASDARLKPLDPEPYGDTREVYILNGRKHEHSKRKPNTHRRYVALSER